MSKRIPDHPRSSKISKVNFRLSSSSTKGVSSKLKTSDANRRAKFDGVPEGEKELGKLPLAVLEPDLYQLVLERNMRQV